MLAAPDGTVSEHRAWLSALNRLWGFARPGDGEDTTTIRDAPAGAAWAALESDEARDVLRRCSDATLAWALNDPPPDDRPTLASSIAHTDAHLADQMSHVRRAA